MRHRLAAALILTLVLPAFGRAADLPEPVGPVVLTVEGAISHTNGDGVARFDLAMLEGLATRDTTTRTPWFDDMRTFSGPLLSTVLEFVGARGDALRVIAVNDYAADMPRTDAAETEAILATRMDGKFLSVREKGPLFVIYPFDERPELYNEVYFGRSVWQVARIAVE